MTAVYVTGAHGFIGRALCDRYRAAGADVRGVDAKARAGDEGGVVSGDISRAGGWQDHARGCDLVIHTAALVNNTADRDRSWEANVLGTRRALDAAVEAGARRFVHFSSVRAFSDLDFPDGVDERHPVRPDGHRYVDNKVASEQVVLQAHSAGEMTCTIIRPSDVYGPGSPPWTLWPVLGIPAGLFFVPDDGQGVFSPVYVDNLVDGVVLAADSDAAAGQVFTISDGIGVTNAEFFGHYARLLNVELPFLPADEMRERFEAAAKHDVARGRKPVVNAESVDYLLRRGTYSIDKARRVLGYDPKIGLAEGMRRTEAWLRASGFLP